MLAEGAATTLHPGHHPAPSPPAPRGNSGASPGGKENNLLIPPAVQNQ